MDAEVSTHTFLTMIIEEFVCFMSSEPIFFVAIILIYLFFFINWTLRMSDNLPERVQILCHMHIICITVLENRIICSQIFCDLLLKSAFEQIFNVMQLILVKIKWHIKWKYKAYHKILSFFTFCQQKLHFGWLWIYCYIWYIVIVFIKIVYLFYSIYYHHSTQWPLISRLSKFIISRPVFQLDQNRGALRPAPEILCSSALFSHPLRPSALSTLPLRPSALFMPYMNPKRLLLCCPLVTLSQNLSN